MKGGSDKALMIGVGLVGLILAVIVYFLAISPKLASASAARDATQARIDQNGLLGVTLLDRQKSVEQVPEYTREIYAIRETLPSSEDVPSIRRLFDQVSLATGYAIDSDSLSFPMSVPGGLSLQAQMEQVGLTSEIEGMLFTTLLATPFQLELVGPSETLGAVIEELRSGGDRYVSIITLAITAGDTGSENDIRVSIGGLFFSLDSGVEFITKKPDDRPWPGTEEEPPGVWENPFGSITPQTAG